MKVTYEFDPYEDKDKLAVFQKADELRSALQRIVKDMEYAAEGSANLTFEDRESGEIKPIPLTQEQASGIRQYVLGIVECEALITDLEIW